MNRVPASGTLNNFCSAVVSFLLSFVCSCVFVRNSRMRFVVVRKVINPSGLLSKQFNNLVGVKTM
jgi:hypothetical protein